MGATCRGGVSKTLDVIRSKNGGISTGTPNVLLWAKIPDGLESDRQTQLIFHIFNRLGENKGEGADGAWIGVRTVESFLFTSLLLIITVIGS